MEKEIPQANQDQYLLVRPKHLRESVPTLRIEERVSKRPLVLDINSLLDNGFIDEIIAKSFDKLAVLFANLAR